MPLFEKKEDSIIGVDIGTSGIKIIELKKTKEGKHSLVTYAFLEQMKRDGHHAMSAAAVGGTIKALVKKARCISGTATAGLPTFSVFTSLMDLPPMSDDELDSAVHWEAKKIIPLPLEDIVLDYRVLNKRQQKGLKLSFSKKEKKDDKEHIKVLITGAAKETVQRYTDIFQQSGLTLVSLETEMFALARSLVGNDPGETMIVEVGSALTDILVVENGIPFLGRSIETGGSAMTRAIMNSLNISEKRAEQLKRDIGLALTGEASGGGVPTILKGIMEPIIHEIRYTMDLYKNHGMTPSGHTSGAVEKIILTGGGSLMPHFAEYLEKTLDIRVYLGDPWGRIAYPEELKPILSHIGPKFSVAIGLALRENE